MDTVSDSVYPEWFLQYAEPYGCVDSALSTMFNETPWGITPVGANVSNPYCEYNFQNLSPAARTNPADFGDFRTSAHNDTVEAALAGTHKGGVFTFFASAPPM